MNNPTYLQKQYAKLTKKLNKAFSTGRFYEYTQYKQQQLLDKFASYTLQMKKLGMVAAVGAAVAMATPAMGQTPLLWQENLGTSNPLDIDTLRASYTSFVDLDNDGDLDIVASAYELKTTGVYSYAGIFKTIYYENIGSATNPNFIKGVTPFPNGESVSFPAFVDIDNDGDLDAFSGNIDYYNVTGDKSVYFENVGSATSPSFVKRVGALNPLDSINFHYPVIGILPSISFVDIDGDNDLDVFHQELDGNAAQGASTVKQILYRNEGTLASPTFMRDTLNNPWTDSLPIDFGSAQFIDIDKDNDWDILKGNLYFENTGSATNPSYAERVQPPQNIFANITKIQYSSILVDIDGDNDLDLFGHARRQYFQIGISSVRDTVTFLENITPSSLFGRELSNLEISVFPNPTTGLINLEKPLTGEIEVFNTLGQVLYTSKLDEQQQINIKALNNGNYTIKIQTKDGVLIKKILIQK